MNFITRLPVLTDYKNKIYNSILIIIDYFTKIVYNKPVKTINNVLGLVKVIFNIII